MAQSEASPWPISMCSCLILPAHPSFFNFFDPKIGANPSSYALQLHVKTGT